MINTFTKSVRVLLSLSIVVLMISMACQNSSVLNPNKTSTKLVKIASTPISSHSDYLSLDLDYSSIFPIRMKLEKHLNTELLNRGEAHITVISPPEFAILKTFVPMYEIEEISRKYVQNLQKNPSQIEALCVGSGHLNSLSTYFIVVKAPSLVQLRREVQALPA